MGYRPTMTVTEKKKGDALVLSLRGDADLAAVPTIQERLHEAIERRVPYLVLDFGGTDFVNTPVWALVVEYYQHTMKSGTRMALAGLHGRVLASFEIVRLGEFVKNYPTVDEAVGLDPATP